MVYVRGNTQCLLHQCTQNTIHTGIVVIIYVKMVTQTKDRQSNIGSGRRFQELWYYSLSEALFQNALGAYINAKANDVIGSTGKG